MAFALFLFVNSCKKELNNGEKIDPTRQKEILAYKNGPKIDIINLAQFQSEANINALGTLKQEFVAASASKSKVMAINTAETYLGFKIITDSIKVIKAKGHTMYIFPVVLPSKRATSFQNLTIDESAAGTVAFVNTYTPTKKWTADWKKGRPGKFDGEISVKYLKLNNGSKSPTQKTIAVAQICTTTTYYFEIPYLCASGNHYPGETCTLLGDERAGYTLYEAIVTECVDDPNAAGGSGGTSPTPPPTYNPCPVTPPAVSGKKSYGNKLMVAPPTPCDEAVDCAGVSGGTAYINTNCNTCMGGTTGITTCPPDIKHQLDDFPCAKSLVLQMTSLDSDISNLIKNAFGKNDRTNLIIRPGTSLAGTSTDGTQNGGFTTTNSDNTKNHTFFIDINPDVLKNSSNEYIIVTLYHEALHAYLALKKQELGATEFNNQFSGLNVNGGRLLGVQDQNHWPMGYTNYVNGLRDVILSYNSNYDPIRAYALAIGGIMTLNTSQSTINNQERNTTTLGYQGTKCL